MKISGATYEGFMLEEALQIEYADIKPSANPGADEAYRYLFEAEQSYLEVMKALALEELKQTVYKQSGFTYHEDNMPASNTTMQSASSQQDTTTTQKKPEEKKGFLVRMIDAVIGFIKKIWNGIVGVWKWLVSKFDKYIRFNDSFVKKYSMALASVKSTKYDGYSFSGLGFNLGNTTAIINPKQMKLDSAKVDLLKSLNMDTTNLDPKPDDFHDKYYGSKNSIEQEFIIAKQLEYITHVNDDKAKVSKLLSKAKALFGVYESAVKDVAKEVNFSEEQVKEAIAYSKWAAPIVYMAFTQYSKALVARANQARAICIKALQDKEAAEQKNESVIPVFTLNQRAISNMLFA